MKRMIGSGIILILAGILILPGPCWAAPQGNLTVALSSDISSLDTQYHNIRVSHDLRQSRRLGNREPLKADC